MHPNTNHQAIITLSDGQQVSIWSREPIDAENITVKYRSSPGAMWTLELREAAPHGRPWRPTIHFGSW